MVAKNTLSRSIVNFCQRGYKWMNTGMVGENGKKQEM
jgi:hypothetical protein